ncbi:hypothetical protein D3C85_1278440 [compost metagenome]
MQFCQPVLCGGHEIFAGEDGIAQLGTIGFQPLVQQRLEVFSVLQCRQQQISVREIYRQFSGLNWQWGTGQGVFSFGGHRRQLYPRQIQLALKGLLTQGTIESFEIGKALLVAGFEVLYFFDDDREHFLFF